MCVCTLTCMCIYMCTSAVAFRCQGTTYRNWLSPIRMWVLGFRLIWSRLVVGFLLPYWLQIGISHLVMCIGAYTMCFHGLWVQLYNLQKNPSLPKRCNYFGNKDWKLLWTLCTSFFVGKCCHCTLQKYDLTLWGEYVKFCKNCHSVAVTAALYVHQHWLAVAMAFISIPAVCVTYQLLDFDHSDRCVSVCHCCCHLYFHDCMWYRSIFA